MDELLSNIEFRNIKNVIISTYFDGNSTEYREIKLIDKNNDVHIIKIRLDKKERKVGVKQND